VSTHALTASPWPLPAVTATDARSTISPDLVRRFVQAANRALGLTDATVQLLGVEADPQGDRWINHDVLRSCA